jgi:hypothetical protein
MKTGFRFVLSAAVLGALTISQLPERGNCQMVYGAMFAASCRMPCCQTKLPMPNCPFLKAMTPHDFIAASAPILKVGLQPLHTLEPIIASATRTWSKLVSNLAETYELLFIGPSQPVRAPPASTYLLAA